MVLLVAVVLVAGDPMLTEHPILVVAAAEVALVVSEYTPVVQA